ncbi:unnamed protein product [Sphagnum compactum]
MCCNSVSKRFRNPFPLRPRLGTCAYFLEMMMTPTPRMLLCFLILSKGWVGTSATRFKRERERGREIQAELLLLSLPSPPWKFQDSSSSRIIPTSSTADI